MGASAQDDLARRLAGVRFLPWPDWPDRLCEARSAATFQLPGARRFEGAFWQQDDAGGFVNAAVRLEALWNGSP